MNFRLSFPTELNNKQVSAFELFVIIGFALVPLFVNLPYRVNIYLSWEGAYRLYSGLIPYRDFGMPTGFGFWLIPAMFFKIFGPYLFTLVKAQVFINIICGFSFRSILKSLDVHIGIRLLSVVVFVLSYSFFNFWPWYNQTVIVFQIIGTSFLFQFLFKPNSKYRLAYLFLSTLFIFLSIFTKQDGGGMAFLICAIIVLYNAIAERSIRTAVLFFTSFLIVTLLFILPLLNYNFLYWFNYGQEPHYSRIDLLDIFNDFFGKSEWIKFYLFLIILILINELKSFKDLFLNKKKFTFVLLTLGILVEASIFQVTSYTPPNNNIFFHSFAFAFILTNLSFNINYSKVYVLLACFVFLFLWWSGVYWKYTNRIVAKAFPKTEEKGDAEKISKNNFMIKNSANKDTRINMGAWKAIKEYKSFEGITMPESTIEGINYIMALDVIKTKGAKTKVLNMSELTPLAHEIGYELEKGVDVPLWYHKGVGMFQKQVDDYCERIEAGEYDVVIFEYIPYLNNFYPFEIRDCLRENYKLGKEFLAPRNPAGDSFIEVYIRP